MAMIVKSTNIKFASKCQTNYWSNALAHVLARRNYVKMLLIGKQTNTCLWSRNTRIPCRKVAEIPS